MLRVLLTIVLPLLLPTALYLLWLGTSRCAAMAATSAAGAACRGSGSPAAGVVLAAIVLFVVTVAFRHAEQGVYVPPRSSDGRDRARPYRA